MKKKIQWKDFLMLQVVFLIYSFTSLTQKLASSFLPEGCRNDRRTGSAAP